MLAALDNQEIRVKGIVQGVGFRPTVYRLALECELCGEVVNDTDGVLIRVSGVKNNIEHFLQRLTREAPPLSHIETIEAKKIIQDWHYQGFTIGQSNHTQGNTEVSADAACCQACLEEISNPEERRYGYPFTNCTHCGPRLSIIRGIPYDRPQTTMSVFPLCNACLKEYSDPLNRRFHAQPIACHDCGPGLFLHPNKPGDTDSFKTASEKNHHHIQTLLTALTDGKTVALKGLGGFHLCCDATNTQAVAQLRIRKQRYAKPFALMCNDLETIGQYCFLSTDETTTLKSPAAPIVLLHKKAQCTLPEAIAPGSNLLGFMLPYTPLHSLVCQQFTKPLVMTSGNFSGEPQIIDNQEAIEKLSTIADLIVYHDRTIENRIDDSVVRYIAGKIRVLRRARGYAPKAIKLPEGFEKSDGIMAYGAELKSAFCLIKQGSAILSQHQGDLEDVATANDYEKNMSLYRDLFEFKPTHLVSDKHPEYISSKFAAANSLKQQIPHTNIQHHHAHIASAMAENKMPINHSPVLGIALDGLGFGDDDTLWGGEFLLADYTRYQRLARFSPVAMPGGAQATKQPWRNTFAQILNSMNWEDCASNFGNTDIITFLNEKPISIVQSMIAQDYNSPRCSSAGRLFDAVAGALGLCTEQVHYEGQAAIELEVLADADAIINNRISNPYPFTIESTVVSDDSDQKELLNLDTKQLWPLLLQDLSQDVDKRMIASRFHAGLINGIMQVIDRLHEKFHFDHIVLSGGCMQNAILLEGLEKQIRKRQLICLTHSLVPANDGGIALGQAVIAAATFSNTNSSQ